MFRKLSLFALIFLLYSCTSYDNSDESIGRKKDRPVFTSSDQELQAAWDWASAKAYSYVREGDAVGPWYEAALPGREAFCMRDVSHQSSGAAVLGLEEETRNMLFRFAENIAETRDWCSYWEITKDNEPAPVDYENDQDFWYNLPANFDVMDACFRMYLWTGDSSYILDPVFLNFYEKTLNEYTSRWDLHAATILERRRKMNLPGDATEENHRFYLNRGIPGYHEGAAGRMLLGIDQLAVQFAANAGYNQVIMNAEPNTRWENEAEILASIINTVFWDDENKKFRIILYDDRSFGYDVDSGQDFSHSLLHYNVLNDTEKINSILDRYISSSEKPIIEIASHLPDIYFRYGHPEEGVKMLKYLAAENTPRREYPENPFSIAGAYATGLMGITADARSNHIITYSGITDPETWATLSGLPVMGKSIDLFHYGRHTSVITNHSAETIYWFPHLEGAREQWFINGKPDRTHARLRELFGDQVSSWMIPVAPRSTASVSAFPNTPREQ